MGTLLVSFAILCLCVSAVPDGKKQPHILVALGVVASIVVFAARVLGFVLEAWGW